MAGGMVGGCSMSGRVSKKAKLGVCLACGNQKGGVGKSTVAVHLAAALGLEGYQCLVVDLDPAAGATRHLGVPEASFAGTLELLTTDEHLAALVIEQDMPRNVHLVPARGQLAELDSLLSKFVDRTRILDRMLSHARECYDFIIFDTSPSAGATTTIAAYAACEWFLLTAFPHPLSFAGLAEACRDIRDVRQYRNPDLEVLGVVFNNVDPRARLLRIDLESLVEELLPGRRFKTTISQAVILPHLSGMGRTLFQEDNWQRLVPARQYHRLATEVLHRVLNRDEFIHRRLDELAEGDDGQVVRLKDNVVSLRTEVKHG
ncbi:MAG: ParA family protein [Planctomycetota bacterium]|nr:ParA family protein [Planctomycetota bacterium]